MYNFIRPLCIRYSTKENYEDNVTTVGRSMLLFSPFIITFVLLLLLLLTMRDELGLGDVVEGELGLACGIMSK